MKHFSFAGVHLLPNHPFPYNQRTYATEGIELESWEHVYVNDLCGNRLQDIAEYFTVVDNFNDTTTGLPQIIWQIKNCPFDFGYQEVYLEILSGENAPIFSTPFYFTERRSEFTSRWDYKDKASDVMLSTGLQIYYRQRKHAKEASVYTAVNNNRSFNPSVKITPYERWNSDVVDNEVLLEFDKIFLCKYRYSQQTGNDVYPVRTGLFEADETPDFEADENFVESGYSFTRDYDLTFNPNAVPVVPPPPPADPPEINLLNVHTSDANHVNYLFTYDNFITTPTEFIYQYSLDQVNWTSIAAGTSTPQTIQVIGHNSQSFYYRIWHFPTDTYSNIVQKAQQSIQLQSVGSAQRDFDPMGNSYQAFFAVNYTPTQSFVFEVSTDGTTWVQATSTAGITSPRLVTTPPNGTEFTYFRMRDIDLGLTSNVYEHSFS